MKSILVVESDNVLLRAAIATRRGKDVEIGSLIEISETDSFIALQEAYQRLQQEKKKTPKKAVLVSSEVAPALLSLPIKKSMTSSEIQQMLRWEMEPHIEIYHSQPQLAAIANAKGLLSKSQLHEINHNLSLVEGSQPASSSDLFKQVISLEPAALEGCETISNNWPSAEDDFVYAWTNRFTQRPNERHWLVAGMSQSRREQWFNAFSELNMTLVGIMPLITSSLPTFNGSIANRSCVILEAAVGVTVGSWLDQHQLQSIEYYPQSVSPIPDQLAGELERRKPEVVQTAGRILNEYRQDVLQPSPESGSPEGKKIQLGNLSSASIIGAAKQILGMRSPLTSVVLAPKPPGPPLKARPYFWWIVTTSITLLLVGAIFLAYHLRIQQQERQREESIRKNDQTDILIEKIENFNRQIELDITKKENLQAEVERTSALSNFHTSTLANQNQIVGQVLNAIIKTVNQGVLIEQLSMNPANGFTIRGWSTSENDAHDFADQLARDVKDIAYKVHDFSIRAEDYRLIRSKYNFQFELNPFEAFTLPEKIGETEGGDSP